MAAKKETFLTRITKSFRNKKMSPEDVISTLRQENAKLDETLHGLEFDLRKLNKERERVIHKGTEAARKGDSSAQQEAAHDLKALNAELSYVQQNRSSLIKSRLLCRMSLRRMTSTLPGGAMDVAQRVIQLMGDEDLNAMLTDKECSEDQYQELIDRKLSVMLGGLESKVNDSEQDFSQEMSMFTELAEAEKEGNMDRVKQVRERMTGDTKTHEGFDSDSLLS